MAKPHVFFDFDGLKFNTAPAHAAYMNERWNIQSVDSDYSGDEPLDGIIKKYNKNSTVTLEEVYEDLGKNFLTSLIHHEKVLPWNGMLEVMPLVAKKYTSWTVTARQKSGIDVIKYLLDKHIRGLITDVHCVWDHKGGGVFHSVTKREFIASIAGEKIAFFDDAPREILDVQDLLPSYLFDPVGTHNDNVRIGRRVRSWEDIGNILQV
jgi:hypothetical protein